MEYYRKFDITTTRTVNGVENTYYGQWFRDETESIWLHIAGQNSLDMANVAPEDSATAAAQLFDLFFTQREALRAAK